MGASREPFLERVLDRWGGLVRSARPTTTTVDVNAAGTVGAGVRFSVGAVP
jgi:hypothetical protein